MARWAVCAWLLAVGNARVNVKRSYCTDVDDVCGYKCTEGNSKMTCNMDEQCKARCKGATIAGAGTGWPTGGGGGGGGNPRSKQHDRTVFRTDVSPCAAPCDFVPKATFDDEVRFVYALGLEHTGHHLWQKYIWPVLDGEYVGHNSIAKGVIDYERASPSNLRRGNNRTATTARARVSSIAAKFRMALGVRRMNWRSKNRTRERKWAHLNDRMLKNMPKALVAIASDRKVWERRSIVGVTACSYPCESSHFDPDVRITASAAEAAGADLRVLLMTRPVQQILYDAKRYYPETGRRRLGGDVVSRVCVLARSCDALRAQLDVLDPAFYQCFPYGGGAPDGGGEFLGTDDATLRAVFDAAWHPKPKAATHAASTTEAAAAEFSPDCWPRLRDCSAAVDRVCTAVTAMVAGLRPSSAA